MTRLSLGGGGKRSPSGPRSAVPCLNDVGKDLGLSQKELGQAFEIELKSYDRFTF